MPRYVLLYHQCPPGYVRPSHWDLMLETGDVLATWTLHQLPRDWQAAHSHSIATDANCPAIADSNSVAAERIGDHRKDYLDLQGELSRDRGRVTQVAAGNYKRQPPSPEHLQIVLAGDVVGGLMLHQADPRQPHWTVTYESTG